MLLEKLPCVEINPTQAPVASVIWLHGLGADGNDFVDMVPELQLPADLPIRFVFPHAPVRSVTINGGYAMRAWYDIYGISLHAKQDSVGITASATAIENLIAQELQRGIPSQCILLGGFSQGGAMALHVGLRYAQRLAGIIALSTYLPLAETLAAQASEANRHTPIFMAHGSMDTVVPLALAEASNKFLQQNSHPVDFQLYPMPHSVCAAELADLRNWLQSIFGGVQR